MKKSWTHHSHTGCLASVVMCPIVIFHTGSPGASAFLSYYTSGPRAAIAAVPFPVPPFNSCTWATTNSVSHWTNSLQPLARPPALTCLTGSECSDYGGIPSEAGLTCCMEECDKCDPNWCTRDLGRESYGADACCVDVIVASGVTCGIDQDAPCNLDSAGE